MPAVQHSAGSCICPVMPGCAGAVGVMVPHRKRMHRLRAYQLVCLLALAGSLGSWRILQSPPMSPFSFSAVGMVRSKLHENFNLHLLGLGSSASPPWIIAGTLKQRCLHSVAFKSFPCRDSKLPHAVKWKSTVSLEENAKHISVTYVFC